MDYEKQVHHSKEFPLIPDKGKEVDMLWLQIDSCSLQLLLSGTAAGYQYSSKEVTVLFYFLLLVVN